MKPSTKKPLFSTTYNLTIPFKDLYNLDTLATKQLCRFLRKKWVQYLNILIDFSLIIFVQEYLIDYGVLSPTLILQGMCICQCIH